MLLLAAPGVSVVGRAPGSETAAEWLRLRRPDAVYLVLGEDGEGLRWARRFDAGALVLCAAAPQWAVAAFELGACDYLLQPFDAPRLHQSLDRAAKSQARRMATPPLRPSCAHDRLPRHAGVAGQDSAVELAQDIWAPRRGLLRRVPASAITWLEAQGDYVRIHAAGFAGPAPLIRRALSTLELTLDHTRFRRVHRSAIVNVGRIANLVRRRNGALRLVLDDGQEVPVGATYRCALIRLIEGDRLVA